MGGFLVLVMIVAGAWYLGLFGMLQGYTYRAEVGYYTGERQDWYVGSDRSYDACIAEATAQYNAMNARSQGRAFSWACRKMQGDSFLERVR